MATGTPEACAYAVRTARSGRCRQSPPVRIRTGAGRPAPASSSMIALPSSVVSSSGAGSRCATARQCTHASGQALVVSQKTRRGTRSKDVARCARLSARAPRWSFGPSSLQVWHREAPRGAAAALRSRAVHAGKTGVPTNRSPAKCRRSRADELSFRSRRSWRAATPRRSRASARNTPAPRWWRSAAAATRDAHGLADRGP